jgi:LPS-assembly protein
VDGIRHIIEPSLNYTFVPAPNRPTNQIPQFDYESPSLRLLPIEFPDYNSIDSIDSQNVIRFGLHNKLQTKRPDPNSDQKLIDNLLNWEVFTDWRLRPMHGQKTFGDVSSDLIVKPRSWMTFESFVRYDINDNNWLLASHTLTLEPKTAGVGALPIGISARDSFLCRTPPFPRATIFSSAQCSIA